MSNPVRDNPGLNRYELEVDGQIVFANYRRRDGTLVITHVEAPVPLRGTGASHRLMQGLMDIVRQDGMKVVPLCGFASAWIRRHKDYADLLAER
ncbi:MAG TPA: GNAT family N-acetyltransferase [Ferrovibrio sp.]|jgi:predicted GNAT family acetyltransferase|uniref:GNAT family N-acetyltransferase n=1 Tax=Ferrovibrio sp. TaxID=1917215 RepID=UPI002B4AE7E2|nr:GNAT family N-acetyltransferase [Ferrovibrio sp.]HLT78242.1 GNAT family N-acetyltransferase [Ferrovibrio sp.]